MSKIRCCYKDPELFAKVFNKLLYDRRVKSLSWGKCANWFTISVRY